MVSGPGVPDAPKAPAVHCRSPHGAVVTWEEPVNNGATIVEYRLEWQQRTDAEFTQVLESYTDSLYKQTKVCIMSL